jgi:hypothetical protein
MIARNEGAALGSCLGCVVGISKDMVVVNAGPVDGTKDRTVRHAAHLFDLPWVYSFAAARNESLRSCGPTGTNT